MNGEENKYGKSEPQGGKNENDEGSGAVNPIKKGKYRHFKGNEYEVLCVARDSETLCDMVVYKALYGEGRIWVRPAEMWSETVVKDGVETPRFVYIGEKEPDETKKER